MLTSREIEIIELCGQGLITKQIAAQLNIAEDTVENHKKHMREKLNAKNMVQVVYRYMVLRREKK